MLFGSYEQDGNTSNGQEKISWTVMRVDEKKALLVSDVCLYAMPYNSDKTDNSWTNSDLRKWLNDEFYQSAFSFTEQGVIIEGEITTERRNDKEGDTYFEPYGEAEVTIDKVFAPDYYEYWKLTSDLNVSAVAKEIFTSHNKSFGSENYRSMFWTRSPFGEERNYASGYNAERESSLGYVFWPNEYAMVRPAIYVDIELYSDLPKVDQEQATSDIERSDSSVDSGISNSNINKTEPHFYCYDDSTYKLGYDMLNFGPGVWVDPNEAVDYNCSVCRAFCERIESDPVMAAAVLSYVDKQMGTRFTGSFYHAENQAEWISGINNAAEDFIDDAGLWSDATVSFESMLERVARFSIIDADLEEIETLKMQQGDEHPIIVGPETQNPTPGKCLVITITIKGTEVTLMFLIDLGFQPVL